MARKAKITKTCTKTGFKVTGTPSEIAEFFYRDKSQKDGFSPWCKAAEKSYNKAYYAGLKAAEAPKKAAIDNEPAKAKFEKALKPERVARKKGSPKKSETKRDGSRTKKAKAETKARKTQRQTKAQAQKA
jgi:hypothetical protein